MMEVKSIFTGCRGVSLPFSDYCEPIITNGIQIQDMIGFIKEYGRKCHWKYIEIRGGACQGATANRSFYKQILSLTPGVEKLFSQLKTSRRSNIRKAMKADISVNIHRSLTAIREFYKLHCITRKRHGLPPQPFYFFKKIYEHIISKNLGIIVLASYGKINIAGAVFFNFQKKSFWKFGASDYTYQHLRANDIIVWEAIKWYTNNGYHTLCFGRTALNNTGLRKYKSEWNVDEYIVNYYKFDLRKNNRVNQVPVKRTLFRPVLRIAPISLLRVLGKVMYKHIG